MKTCKICSEKIKKNSGLSELALNNDERRRLLGLKKDESICIDCKKDLLYAAIISPF
jgi:phage-related protein